VQRSVPEFVLLVDVGTVLDQVVCDLHVSVLGRHVEQGVVLFIHQVCCQHVLLGVALNRVEDAVLDCLEHCGFLLQSYLADQPVFLFDSFVLCVQLDNLLLIILDFLYAAELYFGCLGSEDLDRAGFLEGLVCLEHLLLSEDSRSDTVGIHNLVLLFTLAEDYSDATLAMVLLSELLD